jgi:hypothetical protein
MPSLAINNLHRMFACMGNPERGMVTGASAALLGTSRTAVHLRHRRAGQSSTTIDVPTQERTSMRKPTLTLHHSSGECPKTLPLQPCYCAAARSRQPLRDEECVSN